MRSTIVEALCARAGVTARHFYEAVGSREALLLAVYDESIERHLAHVGGALAAAPADLEGHVRAGIEAAIGAWADDLPRARIGLVEVVGVSPEAEAHRLGALETYGELIRVDVERLHGLGLVSRPPGPYTASPSWAPSRRCSSRGCTGATIARRPACSWTTVHVVLGAARP